MRPAGFRPCWLLFAFASACASDPDADGLDSTSGEATQAGDGSTESGSGSTSDSGGSSDDDGPAGSICDPEEQDCPDGFKCVLVQKPNQYGFVCVEASGTDSVGDPCSHDGITKGTDTCDDSSFCFGQTDFNGQPWDGLCYPFCRIDDPDSCGQSATCLSAGGIPVCADRCNPLISGDCGDDGSCIYRDSASGFVCFPLATEVGGVGARCLSGITCEDGLACVQGVAGCTESDRCCTEICDTTSQETVCSAADQGAVCVSLEVQVPGQTEVGACKLPD